MIPDHWGFIVSAYGIAIVAVGGYWRRLVRRQREFERARGARRSGALEAHRSGALDAHRSVR